MLKDEVWVVLNADQVVVSAKLEAFHTIAYWFSPMTFCSRICSKPKARYSGRPSGVDRRHTSLPWLAARPRPCVTRSFPIPLRWCFGSMTR